MGQQYDIQAVPGIKPKGACKRKNKFFLVRKQSGLSLVNLGNLEVTKLSSNETSYFND